jgi:hypothetical protein
MKFDSKKPHGVITNHPWARFEQNGILYDCQGQPMDQLITEENVTEEEQSIESNDDDFSLKNAKEFLLNILANGALARSVIFKECNANNQNWESVKTAFADLGGEVFYRRNVIHWKLKSE